MSTAGTTIGSLVFFRDAPYRKPFEMSYLYICINIFVWTSRLRVYCCCRGLPRVSFSHETIEFFVSRNKFTANGTNPAAAAATSETTFIHLRRKQGRARSLKKKLLRTSYHTVFFSRQLVDSKCKTIAVVTMSAPLRRGRSRPRRVAGGSPSSMPASPSDSSPNGGPPSSTCSTGPWPSKRSP